MDMDPKVFEKFSNLAYEKAGINLKEGKEALVSARVGKRIRSLGLSGAEEYLKYLENSESDEEIINFLDVISTNFTNFFRENDHFEFLNTIVQQWYVAGQRRFRFWSAASSSGQEPYSIAISLAELFGDQPVDCKILATDISTKVLNIAQSAMYPEKTIEGISRLIRSRYFDEITDPETREKSYKIVSSIREKVIYKRLNLAKPPFPMPGPLDVVFCRNVMIYFDNMVRQGLVSEVERLLKPNGFLIIGHTETLNGLRTGLKAVRPSIYRKTGD
jgi:chemotaxis protein methyltransferase CheR